jgi:hypothetical protein
MKKAFAVKTIVLMTCLGSLLTTGCARRYTVTMENGGQISVMGKPKLENGEWVFKDATGKPVKIPQGSVREVAPASMASSRMDSGFKATPMK